MTYELIETVTLTSSASSIEFSSIPQDGTDLVVLLSGRATGADYAGRLDVRVNGDTGFNYSYRYLTGYNANVQTNAGTSIFIGVQTQIPGTLSTANTFGNAAIYFSNYAGSTQKSVSIDTVSENNAIQAAPGIAAGLWTGTAAITSISMSHSSGNFDVGSTASLYKITKFA